MSTVSATAAQRLEVRDEAVKVAQLLQGVVQVSQAPSTEKGAIVDAALTPLVAACAALGATTALPATQTIVSSGQALTGVTPSGVYTNTVTFTVAGGVITAIVLS